MNNLPPLPPGFTLVDDEELARTPPTGQLPPLPPGFTLVDEPPQKSDSEPLQGRNSIIGATKNQWDEMFTHPLLNVAAGAVRGAGAIGNTLWSIPQLARGAINQMQGNKAYTIDDAMKARQERAEGMDAGLETILGQIGVKKQAIPYEVGKIVGETAGTAGVGPAIAIKARGLLAGSPALAAKYEPLLQAVQTGGFGKDQLGNLATRALGGSVGGAASAALTEPQSPWSILAGAGVGGALPIIGRALAKAKDTAVNWIAPRAGPALDEATDAVRRGMPVGTGDITTSKFIKELSSKLNEMPFSGSEAARIAKQEWLNKEVGKTFGANSNSLTKGVVENADKAIKYTYEKLLGGVDVKYDQQMSDAIKKAIGSASSLPSAERAALIKMAEDLESKMIHKGISPGMMGYSEVNPNYVPPKSMPMQYWPGGKTTGEPNGILGVIPGTEPKPMYIKADDFANRPRRNQQKDLDFGYLPGDAVHNFQQVLGELSAQGPTVTKRYYGQLRGEIKDSIGRTIGPKNYEELKDVDLKYRNLLAVRPILDRLQAGAGVGAGREIGDVPAVLLPNRSYGVFGKDIADQELASLGTLGNRYMVDRVKKTGGTVSNLFNQLGGGSMMALGFIPARALNSPKLAKSLLEAQALQQMSPSGSLDVPFGKLLARQAAIDPAEDVLDNLRGYKKQ